MQWGIGVRGDDLGALPPMVLGMLSVPADQPVDDGGGVEGIVAGGLGAELRYSGQPGGRDLQPVLGVLLKQVIDALALALEGDRSSPLSTLPTGRRTRIGSTLVPLTISS